MTELKRVLVVDDQESVLFVLNGALAKIDEGYEIESYRATSGEEAMAKARVVPFDLLITDIRLPGIDGLELTAQIKGLHADIQVIWITAYGCQKLLVDAQRLGVYRCLDKPLEIGQIRRVAIEALDQQARQVARR